MSSPIQKALVELFEQYRLIFWYAPDEAMQAEREHLELPGVEILEIHNNEFALKKRVLLDAPRQQFLFYSPREAPDDYDNWLLDLEIRGHRFQTDAASLYLQSLKLPYHLRKWMERHQAFFNNKERRERYAKQLEDPSRETEDRLTHKLLTTVFQEPNGNLSDLLLAYAGMIGQPKKLAQIEHQLEAYKLKAYFWERVAQAYGYQSGQPTIYSFILGLIKGRTPLVEGGLGKDGGILFSQWRDRTSAQEVLQKLLKRTADDLKIEELAARASLENLLRDHYFEEAEKEVIRRLSAECGNGALSARQMQEFHEQRRNGFWYPQYQPYYQAMEYGLNLLEEVARTLRALPKEGGLEAGAIFYTQHAFRVDQAYRQFLYGYRRLENNLNLQGLYSRVNRAYIETWQPELGRWWQERLDQASWSDFPVRKLQRRFYEDVIQPMLHQQKRVFVIISDALRYECAEQLHRELQERPRYAPKLDYRITSLPSYTQLGMASLLPHRQLRIKECSDTVLADDHSTQGMENRRQILKAHYGEGATAIPAADLLKMNKEEGRAFVRDHELIYLYHDQIDQTGDQRASEDQVFEAAATGMEQIKKFISKIYSLNGYNIFITADHGFLYQDLEVAEGDFSPDEVSGEVWKRNRRFLLGRNLQGGRALRAWKGDDFKLNPDMDILTPNGHQRLRVQGAGSRFVHGGGSLAEIITPMLHVRVVKEDTVAPVDVELIRRSKSINSNILQAGFIQTEPLSPSRTKRTLRVFLRASDGTVLSDTFPHTFESEDTYNRQREYTHTFQLSDQAARNYNNQTVYLVAEEPIRGTGKSEWREYQTWEYRMVLFMEPDF